MKVSAAGRTAFFSSVRNSLGPMRQGQVDGITAILNEADGAGIDDRWTAYMLATAWHETAAHMQPVIETRQPGETTNPSVDEAIRRLEKAWAAGKLSWVRAPYWRKDADGLSWLGRGLPQTTHRENYLRLENVTGIPLTKNPDLALDPAHAVTIMFAGMIGGLYTGKKLGDYFSLKTADLRSAWRSARQIVNGLEKADVVAGYATKFYAALQIAGQAAVASRATPSSASQIVGNALNPPAQPNRGPSPAPASSKAATKESTMSGINFGAGFANVFENLAHSIFAGAGAVASPAIDTKTSDGNPITNFGADISDAKAAGSEILEIVGDFRRKDLAGTADDAIDLARVVFGALDRRGVKVPIVTDAIKSIDLDPNG